MILVTVTKVYDKLQFYPLNCHRLLWRDTVWTFTRNMCTELSICENTMFIESYKIQNQSIVLFTIQGYFDRHSIADISIQRLFSSQGIRVPHDRILKLKNYDTSNGSCTLSARNRRRVSSRHRNERNSFQRQCRKVHFEFDVECKKPVATLN